MIGKGKIRLALCLVGALMMTGLACQPSGTSAPTPTTSKPADQKPGGPPKPDPG
jgi:hypothetical protein